MPQPEKLSTWDRIFNRRRKEVISEFTETWYNTYDGRKVEGTDFTRKVVKYRIVDRVTGSETIYYDYLS